MRFEAVTLRRFGPFADRTFQFAPGMTVFYGPNEAGKSSVHAALFAGLCGMRRARGQPRDDERVFAARHRPWDGNGWAVSALVVLADGRSIELEQELESKSACRAVDATLGRDCSGEIIFEGTPDGARFLGLDRRVFPAIACVRQADILGVLDNSKHLQEHLQRAAATAGTDATAAAALQRLREFRSTQVGQDVANSNRPLPVARRAVDEAKQRLEKVRDEHDDYLALLVEVERLENARQAAQRALDLFDAALAAQVAEKWQRRLDEARDLLARYPSGPPSNVVADDALAQEVSAALKLWDERPAPEPLSGPTAAELRAQLEALPALPVGDLEPDPAVVEAANALRVATAALEDHQAQAPPEPAEVATGGLSVQDLRDLARDLATPDPPVDPALAARFDQAQRRVEEASRPRRYLGAWLVASVLLVLALLTA